MVLFLVDNTVARVPASLPQFNEHYNRFLQACYPNKVGWMPWGCWGVSPVCHLCNINLLGGTGIMLAADQNHMAGAVLYRNADLPLVCHMCSAFACPCYRNCSRQ